MTGVPEETWVSGLGRAGFAIEDMVSKMGSRCGGDTVMRRKMEDKDVVIMK
jgi:hypothetical protein